MKNITLAIDEKVLAAVRRYAAQNKTTVNALVRAAMESIAKRGKTSEKAWDELFEAADREGAEIGSRDVVARRHPWPLTASWTRK